MENAWKTIIDDRLKRGYYSPLTFYFVKTIEKRQNQLSIEQYNHKSHYHIKQQNNKYYRKNSLSSSISCHHQYRLNKTLLSSSSTSTKQQIDNTIIGDNANDNNVFKHSICQKTVLRIPERSIQLLYSSSNQNHNLMNGVVNLNHTNNNHTTNIPIIINFPTKIESGPIINNNTVVTTTTPLIHFNNQTASDDLLKQNVIFYPTNVVGGQWIEEKSSQFKWPGLEAILSSYKEYSKGTFI